MQEEHITGVWFEKSDRVDKAFTRLMVYSERGNLILRPQEIVYFGKKINFVMNPLKEISLYEPKHFATKGVPYIKIDYIDPQNKQQTAYFIKGAITTFKAKKETEKLYQKLQNQYPLNPNNQ